MEKPGGQKTFGSSVSFDLDLPNPTRRRRKKARRRVVEEESRAPTDVDCPGCGHALPKEEWLQALVGFVSGAHAFDVGSPVQPKVVQTLYNTVTNMDLPHPRDVWELSIVARLNREFETMVEAEMVRRNALMSEMYTHEEMEAYGRQIQQDTLNYAESALAEQLEREIRAALEPQLRREIEQALWKQFDEELARRSND